jgi:hypothetical protein
MKTGFLHHSLEEKKRKFSLQSKAAMLEMEVPRALSERSGVDGDLSPHQTTT